MTRRCKSRRTFKTFQNPWPPYDNTITYRCRMARGHEGPHRDKWGFHSWTVPVAVPDQEKP